jgi:hypothetical protein
MQMRSIAQHKAGRTTVMSNNQLPGNYEVNLHQIQSIVTDPEHVVLLADCLEAQR